MAKSPPPFSSDPDVEPVEDPATQPAVMARSWLELQSAVRWLRAGPPPKHEDPRWRVLVWVALAVTVFVVVLLLCDVWFNHAWKGGAGSLNLFTEILGAILIFAFFRLRQVRRLRPMLFPFAHRLWKQLDSLAQFAMEFFGEPAPAAPEGRDVSGKVKDEWEQRIRNNEFELSRLMWHLSRARDDADRLKAMERHYDVHARFDASVGNLEVSVQWLMLSIDNRRPQQQLFDQWNEMRSLLFEDSKAGGSSHQRKGFVDECRDFQQTLLREFHLDGRRIQH